MNIMTIYVMNMFRLKINYESTLQLRSLSKSKTKLEGVVSNVVYPMLLGRPWLRRMVQ